MTIICRVLMVYPKFIPNSFWNYTEPCELVGAKYPAAPLGLITVAAMLPKHWDIRLVNRNTEPLTDADLDWADLVMIGGMLNQQPDFMYLIDLAHLHGKPVCVGGPDVSSSPHLYADADFQVIGEAEKVIEQFIAAWESGERKGVFVAEKFKIDVTLSPMPRYDLIKFDHYLFIGVQYSRGCPFTCEFCDIIELYGRVPRTKTNDQILAELQTLYDHGYRGHVDFVDDNFIGNKKNLRTLLPRLKAWLEEARLSVRVLDRSLDQYRGRQRAVTGDEGRELLRDFRRHREPGSRDARADEEKAEHQAQHRGVHP